MNGSPVSAGRQSRGRGILYSLGWENNHLTEIAGEAREGLDECGDRGAMRKSESLTEIT